MRNEPIVEGGKIVELASGRIAIEGGTHRPGDVVHSACVGLNGGRYTRGSYRVGRRVIANTDLRYLTRLGPVAA